MNDLIVEKQRFVVFAESTQLQVRLRSLAKRISAIFLHNYSLTDVL